MTHPTPTSPDTEAWIQKKSEELLEFARDFATSAMLGDSDYSSLNAANRAALREAMEHERLEILQLLPRYPYEQLDEIEKATVMQIHSLIESRSRTLPSDQQTKTPTDI